MDTSLLQTAVPSVVSTMVITKPTIASTELAKDIPVSSNSGLKPKKETSQEKVDFANSAYQKALEIESEYGIPAQVTFAQACLETGYGKSFTGKNNIFNIKDYSGDSKSTRATVLEYDSSGRKITENSYFKGYDNVDSSYADYASLLKRKYQPTNGNSVDDWFASIKKNGYATDPNYIKSLKGVLDYWGIDY